MCLCSCLSVIFACAATPGAGGMLVYRRVRRPAAKRRMSGDWACSGTQSTNAVKIQINTCSLINELAWEVFTLPIATRICDGSFQALYWLVSRSGHRGRRPGRLGNGPAVPHVVPGDKRLCSHSHNETEHTHHWECGVRNTSVTHSTQYWHTVLWQVAISLIYLFVHICFCCITQKESNYVCCKTLIKNQPSFQDLSSICMVPV